MIVSLRNETDGMKPVLRCKRFSLDQGFARDGGNVGEGAIVACVKDQIRNGIGRGPVQRALGFFTSRLIVQPSRIDRHELDLIVRDQNLAA